MIKRILNADWKYILPIINHMSKRSGRFRIALFIDMYKTYKKYGYTWLNFYTFNFDRVTDIKTRRTFFGHRDTAKIYDEFKDSEELKYIQEKSLFIKKYKKFLGRETLELTESNFDEFKIFVIKHPIFFAKASNEKGGYGVKRVDSSKYEINDLYNDLVNDSYTILEEPIVQHEEMNKLSKNSVNSIRVGTVVDNEGKVHVMYAVLRLSVDGKFVDNASQGGYWVKLSEDGYITKPLYRYNPTEEIIYKNPYNNLDYIGVKIPLFDEVKDLAIKAASEYKKIKYIGWDIAITKSGPVLIEGNDYPGVDIIQTYVQLDGNTGMVENFEKSLGMKLR